MFLFQQPSGELSTLLGPERTIREAELCRPANYSMVLFREVLPKKRKPKGMVRR